MNGKWLLALMLSTTLIACERHDNKPAAKDTRVEDVDNTGRNARDSDFKTLTPGDQSENQNDILITKRIRAAIIDNDSLSTNAKNIKIITVNGVVTLRGVVASDVEKAVIARIANSTSGINKVDNQLEIKKAQ